MDLEVKKFSDIDLSDPFFDSLRANYHGFDQWYLRKANEGETAFVFYGDNRQVSDFLYLKIETGAVEDVSPMLPEKKRLKVGTFKLLSRHTRRGERFMKKIMDYAISNEVDEIYVTIFPFEDLISLIHLFERFGFFYVADKPHDNGLCEHVLVKDMHVILGDVEKDYPFIRKRGTRKRLLSIYPAFHTKLFPDSILDNESYDIVRDITPTNSIYKLYICWMENVATLKNGDIVVIYRTNDGKGPAYFRSVATSVCTVTRILRYDDFRDIDDFLQKMRSSVFSEGELRKWYCHKSNFIVIEMLYNAAFSKRLIRKDLLEIVGIPSDAYWGFCELTDEQFDTIITLGEVNERYFVD